MYVPCYYDVLLSLCAGSDQAFRKQNFLGLQQQFCMLKISSTERELYNRGYMDIIQSLQPPVLIDCP